MAKRVAITNLDASTVDILNVIRSRASYEYQQLVPKVSEETKMHDIPAVGEVLYGYPALANQFINALVNRIALVQVKSAVFNNAYSQFKKGYLEFGETVEEVFVNISKAREFSPEKAEGREFKRSLPDVRSAFHTMNWRVQYPITIQDEDLRQAFLSINGVQDLIAKIVDSVYTAAEYDEYLLFKYLLIKAISGGKMFPVAIKADPVTDSAVQFRAMSNLATFMSTKYNVARVHTVTPRSDQLIIMDSTFNAQFDVNVLSAAFNMDKADFIGRLMLVDDWTTFDNDRFSVIRKNSDMIEAVTQEELALLANVKAVLVDREWFQVYDNQNKFTETYVASGEYWNYFYNVWKTVSTSPFSNAIVFVEGDTVPALPTKIDLSVDDKITDANNIIINLVESDNTPSLTGGAIVHQQVEAAVSAGIAVHRYGSYIFPANASAITPKICVNGTLYQAGSTLDPATAAVGDVLEFTPVVASAKTVAKVAKK